MKKTDAQPRPTYTGVWSQHGASVQTTRSVAPTSAPPWRCSA